MRSSVVNFVRVIFVVIFLAAATAASAQSPVVTLQLDSNQIGLVKTTPGITTRVSFPDTVKEIICGDLYDATTGKGTFVVQSSSNDIYLKPVASKGYSNMFVKVGEKGEQVYNFDLQVVGISEANRIINVISGQANAAQGQKPEPTAEAEKIVADARQQADIELRNARQQASQIVKQAERYVAEADQKARDRAAELEREALANADRQIQDRFVRAIIEGVREIKVTDSRVSRGKIVVTLDSRMLSFDRKSYLRYSIKNDGDKDFTFGSLSLEKRSEKNSSAMPIEIIQGKVENTVRAGGTVVGVIVFDSKLVGPNDKLALYVRGQDNGEVARLNIN